MQWFRDDFKRFSSKCRSEIAELTATAKQHRGWYKIAPVIRAILGVLAAIAILPACILALSKYGYVKPFFGMPSMTAPEEKVTEYVDKLHRIEEDIAQTIAAHG